MADVNRHDRILRKDDCALVVLDIQESLFPHIHEGELLETNAGRLIRAARVMGLPIIVTEQYAKGLGPTIPSVQKELGEHYSPIDKLSFSCWLSDGFREAVKASGRTQFLITGIESHVCVEQTALDLSAEGLQVHIATDAVSSRTPRNQKVGHDKMQVHGAVLTSTESAIFELLEYSGTDEFKELLPMLKEMM